MATDTAPRREQFAPGRDKILAPNVRKASGYALEGFAEALEDLTHPANLGFINSHFSFAAETFEGHDDKQLPENAKSFSVRAQVPKEVGGVTLSETERSIVNNLVTSGLRAILLPHAESLHLQILEAAQIGPVKKVHFKGDSELRNIAIKNARAAASSAHRAGDH